MGTHCTKVAPLVYVTGYPKSGTTWVCQLTADYLRLPFPQDSLFPMAFKAVVHGHTTVRRSYPRGLYVVRDGRDALTSFYFHTAREMDGNTPLRAHRRAFPNLKDKNDVRANIGDFIRVNMERPLSASCHWGEHVKSFGRVNNPNMALVKYEDLIGPNKHDAFAAAMTVLDGKPADPDRVAATLTKYSFERITGRKAGQEARDEFLRKGQSGDWINHFTREAAEIFNRYAGDSLIDLGYERDQSWVERCT
jgi:hypothetical protein